MNYTAKMAVYKGKCVISVNKKIDINQIWLSAIVQIKQRKWYFFVKLAQYHCKMC